MVGANYMGGKRNAAKARTKDVSYRLHKEHFDKQRTKFLVQGLGSQDATRNFNKRTAIDLAHAKRDTETYDSVPSTSGVNESSKTSSPWKSKSQPDPRKQSNSKLLTILENTEPISFRSKRERLLKITDFVGLSTRETVSPTQCDPIIPLPRKRRMPDSPGSPPYPVGKRMKLVPVRDGMRNSPHSDLHTSPQTHNSSSTLLDSQEPIFETSEQKSSATTEWVRLGDRVPIHSSNSGYHDYDVQESLVSDTAHVSPSLWKPPRRGYWYTKRTSTSMDDLNAADGHRDMDLNLVENTATSNSSRLSPHDLDMSSDWYAMADALELPQFEGAIARVSCERPQLGWAGVDFYLSPGSCDPISPLKKSSETSPVSVDSLGDVFGTNCSDYSIVMEKPLTDVPASEQDNLHGSHILRAELPNSNFSDMSFTISKPPSKMELLEHNIQSDEDEIFTSQNLAPEGNVDGVAKGLGCLLDFGTGRDPAHFTSKNPSQDQDKRLLPEINLFLKKDAATDQKLPEDKSQDVIERTPRTSVPVTLFSPSIATTPHFENPAVALEVYDANSTTYPSTDPSIYARLHECPPDFSTLNADIQPVQALSRGVHEAAVGMTDTSTLSLGGVRTESVYHANQVPSDEMDLNKIQCDEKSQRKNTIHSTLPGKDDIDITNTFDTEEASEMQQMNHSLDGPLLFGAEFEEEEGYQDDTRIGEYAIQQNGPEICRTDIVDPGGEGKKFLRTEPIMTRA